MRRNTAIFVALLPVVLAAAAPAKLRAQAADSATRRPPVTIGGYITTSYTASTHAQGGIVVGRLFGWNHEQPMLNVGDLVVERVAATDRWDAGFRFEPTVGQNAAVVKSVGLDLGPHADVFQAYVTVNLPIGKQASLQLKAGKMATLMGLEVFEDVLNPNTDFGTQAASLMPFSETGVEVTGRLGSHVDAELRVTKGWDVVTDNNRGKSMVARVGLAVDDATTIAFIGYSGPEQPATTAYSRSGAEVLASRKLGSRIATWLELDYGQEDGVTTGGGTARWYAVGSWVGLDFSARAGLGLRADYINDRDGARLSGILGYPVNSRQRLGSVTGTLNLKPWRKVLVRPELRYDRSSLPVYASHREQFSAGLTMSRTF